MALPENSGSTTRPEHPSANKGEENDFKNNFMEVIKALKEKMKNLLKEMEEKTKIWKISINPLKKPRNKRSNN